MESVDYRPIWGVACKMLPGKWRMKNKINNKSLGNGDGGRWKEGIRSKLLRTANSEQKFCGRFTTQAKAGKREMRSNGECEEHAYLSNNFLTLFSGFCFVLWGFSFLSFFFFFFD